MKNPICNEIYQTIFRGIHNTPGNKKIWIHEIWNDYSVSLISLYISSDQDLWDRYAKRILNHYVKDNNGIKQGVFDFNGQIMLDF